MRASESGTGPTAALLEVICSQELLLPPSAANAGPCTGALPAAKLYCILCCRDDCSAISCRVLCSAAARAVCGRGRSWRVFEKVSAPQCALRSRRRRRAKACSADRQAFGLPAHNMTCSCNLGLSCSANGTPTCRNKMLDFIHCLVHEGLGVAWVVSLCMSVHRVHAHGSRQCAVPCHMRITRF